MTCRILLVTACAMVLGTSSVAAQGTALRPHPSSLFVPPAVATDPVKLAPTYWKEGALIGGGIGAAFGVYVGLEFCRYEDVDCATGVLLGGALFRLFAAIPGALIGGQFHKKE